MPEGVVRQSIRSLRSTSPAVQGALWAITAAIAFTIMGSLIRVVSQEMSVATIVFFRSALGLPLLALWLVTTGRLECFRTTHTRAHFARAACGASSLACLVVAFRNLDFALATALAYTTPLFVIVVSVLFLGERPGWKRSLATGMGFIGVLVIVRPLPLLEIGVWAALASALLGAVAVSFVRHLIAFESTETLLFYFYLFVALLSFGPMVYDGHVPTTQQFFYLAGISAAGMMGLACAAQAFRLADTTIVAPFDFLRLPLASVIGFVFFAETPDGWLLAGSSIMIISLYGIIAFGRHRV